MPTLPRFRSALLAGTALVLPVAAAAQTIAPNTAPVLDRVVAGSITVHQNAAQTTVQQGQQRGIVDWRTFNVGQDHTVRFQQPNASSITLNRVTTPDPSTIAGRITANGQIAIVNQSGVVFTQGAQVDAAGLIVSSANITNENFMAGRMVFDQPGRPDARIENAGTITIREAGLAALVAPQVSNRGVIAARLGRVALAGGETHVIDLYGDGLLSIEVTGAVRQASSDGAALVTNTGVIEAQGGTVLLTAAAADGIVQDLVRANGRIAADTDAATGRTGAIAINGTGGAVRIEGEVRAVGTASGTRGGRIEVVADRVLVDGGAQVNASGAAGGGEVAVGTTLRGAANPRLARRTGIAQGATVRADATERGDGGTVIINSLDYTGHGGTVSARGGPQGGNGGFIEVSGQAGLLILGSIDTSAPQGASGTILIDPVNLSIIGEGDTLPGADQATLLDNVLSEAAPPTEAYLWPSQFESISGAVVLEASNNITVSAGINRMGGSLTMNAGNDILIEAPISSSDTVVLNAGNNVIIENSVQSSADVTVLAGNGIRINGSLLTFGTALSAGGTLDLQAGLGGITQAAAIRAGVLQVRSAGDAMLDLVSTGPFPPPNRVGVLGPSDVAGNFTLQSTELSDTGIPLLIGGLVRVGGRLSLFPETGVLQLDGSVIQASEFAAATPAYVSLGGANLIQAISGISAGTPREVNQFVRRSVDIVNATTLTIAGAITADDPITLSGINIQVTNGDLVVAAPVTATGAGQGAVEVQLAATGNIAVTSQGSVTATGGLGGFIRLVAGSDTGGGMDLSSPGGLSLAGNVLAENGTVYLAAGLGGIVQTGGGITAGGLYVWSGGDARLSSAENNIETLRGMDVGGAFTLDNGTNDLFIETGPPSESDGIAGSIGLRTAGTVIFSEGVTFVASDPAGQMSFRVGGLWTSSGGNISAPTIEIAPFSPTAMAVPAPESPPDTFSIAPSVLEDLNFQTLRLGATTFDGVMTTTATSLAIVAPLAIPGTLDLRSLGDITQDGDAGITAGTLTGASGGSTVLTDPTNVITSLAGFAAGGDFSLFSQGPLLSVPGGTTVTAGGTLLIQVAGGGLLVDGTVVGGTTSLISDQSVTVNGFSAIATAGSLLLQAPVVTLAGLAQAAGDIVVDASSSANLSGIARTPGALSITSPGVTFGGLDAHTADVRLTLGTGGYASGAVDAGGMLVQGGQGVQLTGTIAGLRGPIAAAFGGRTTVDGVPLLDPLPNAFDFTFNGCPLGSFVCAAPLFLMPVLTPEALTAGLDPAMVLAAADQLRPPIPDLNLQPTRDPTEDSELAPPDIRSGDY